MTKTEFLERLKELEINASTMSFYVDENGNEQSDTSFGTCEISGIKGDVAGCTYLDNDDNIQYIEVGTWLISGRLGKLAGAF